MNIWSKVLTALRGEINDLGESIFEGQALRVLDQEIREAAEDLKKSKQSLAKVMAKHKLLVEICEEIALKIKEYEVYTLKAIKDKDEDLALALSGKIACLKDDLETELDLQEHYRASITQLQSAIKLGERDIKLLKQQLETVKATESVQRAQAAVAKRFNGTDGKLRTATDSLQSIKQNQAIKNAKIEAAKELAANDGDAALLERLKKAGISPELNKAEKVLENLSKGST